VSLKISVERIILTTSSSNPYGRLPPNPAQRLTRHAPDSAAYTVSKHAITGLTRSTSLDGRKYGITATQLDIGNAQTAMGGHAAKGCRQADGSIKSEPMMDVANVGNTLVFLAGLDTAADVLHLELLYAFHRLVWVGS
jgi:NAD(P)-dependent dehydrogenase (short-subunit alcohol dehydrogenase family)